MKINPTPAPRTPCVEKQPLRTLTGASYAVSSLQSLIDRTKHRTRRKTGGRFDRARYQQSRPSPNQDVES
ncbi:hypothetical protein QUB25_13965 [Microcoleus sp. B3-D7]